MARTVFANKRNFSHKGSGDTSICSAPDVCKTPVGSATPPIPYPITSMISDLGSGTSSVSIDGNSTAIASSTHTKCTGDQPGSLNGLISSTMGDKTQFSSYSFDVKCEGEGVVRHMDMTTMNNSNTVGGVLGAMDGGEKIEVIKEEAISIIFQRKPRTMKHEWWPKERRLAYSDESYDLTTTTDCKGDNLDGMGSVAIGDLPPGDCSIKYSEFYTEIEDWINERLK